MKTSNLTFLLLLLTCLVYTGCDDDDGPSIMEPTTYSFERDGQTTVSFSGQTARIQMGEELISAMKNPAVSAATLLEMFRNQTESGGDANPFSSAALNDETKSIASKVAASEDFFSSNTATQAAIRAEFEAWINAQVSEVYPRWEELATAGIAGQIADGSSTRYVNAQGLEYNQLVNKSLIGALMLDQALNNYLGTAVLDAGMNRDENNDGIVATDKNYTTMEHKWDEAYGYLYGTSPSEASPVATTGDDDSFLNKYVGRVEGDDDFAGISQRIFDAFKRGRAAIVAGDYDERDVQAQLLREELSKVIGVRAVYYLQQGKNALAQATPDFGGGFHDISEGYGFIFSLQFTRQPDSRDPYFTHEEVNSMLDDLLGDGSNGLWDVTSTTLDNLSNMIADRFDFTVEQAGS
ncbi:MAG: DUF4856 domain-containing protein [Bacteroidota bacterium]